MVSSGRASNVLQPGPKMSGWYGYASDKGMDWGRLWTADGGNGDEDEDEYEGVEEGDGEGDG